MFDSIVLRRSPEQNKSLTAGQVAEALLYYQRIYLLLERGTLESLVKQVGTSTLLTILRRPEVSAVYVDEFLGVITEKQYGFEFHRCGSLQMSETAAGKPLKSAEDRLNQHLAEIGINTSEARKFSKDFLKKVPTRTFSRNHFTEGGLLKRASDDLVNQEYVSTAAREILKLWPGGYDPGDDFKFQVHPSDNSLAVFTNIDFDRVNSHRQVDHDQLLTRANMLETMLHSSADVLFAAHNGSDIATSDLSSAVITARHRELLRRTKLNRQEQSAFEQQIVLPDAPRLADVIDSGDRTFEDFLKLLDKSEKFKAWLKSTSPDEGIVREYLAAISKESWVESLPAKLIRYIAMAGVDATTSGYPIVSKAASVIDTFVLDKLVKGWKPNQFVNNRLRPFVDITSAR